MMTMDLECLQEQRRWTVNSISCINKAFDQWKMLASIQGKGKGFSQKSRGAADRTYCTPGLRGKEAKGSSWDQCEAQLSLRGYPPKPSGWGMSVGGVVTSETCS